MPNDNISVSQRGVVVFRGQDDLDREKQQYLIQRMGELTGKPKESSLHINPLAAVNSEYGISDKRVAIVSSEQVRRLHVGVGAWLDLGSTRDRQSGLIQWHSDDAYETVPPDYGSLRITEPPATGGGTLQ